MLQPNRAARSRNSIKAGAPPARSTALVRVHLASSPAVGLVARITAWATAARVRPSAAGATAARVRPSAAWATAARVRRSTWTTPARARRIAWATTAWVGLLGCASSSPRATQAPVAAGTQAAGESTGICGGNPWALGVVGGGAQVVVLCPSDVKRQALDPNGPMAPAIAPGLDPARERVCSCAARMKAPPFVDLVFTAKPDEGRVSVVAKDDDELDPEVAPPFVACIGTVSASFAKKFIDGACEGGGAATLVYPVRVELSSASSP